MSLQRNPSFNLKPGQSQQEFWINKISTRKWQKAKDLRVTSIDKKASTLQNFFSQSRIGLQAAQLQQHSPSTFRKNLHYDYEERIIYISGCNLVIANFNKNTENQKLNQEFIKIDCENSFSSSPEISTIAFSDDSKILCAATIQANAKLIIWDIYRLLNIKLNIFNQQNMYKINVT